MERIFVPRSVYLFIFGAFISLTFVTHVCLAMLRCMLGWTTISQFLQYWVQFNLLTNMTAEPPIRFYNFCLRFQRKLIGRLQFYQVYNDNSFSVISRFTVCFSESDRIVSSKWGRTKYGIFEYDNKYGAAHCSSCQMIHMATICFNPVETVRFLASIVWVLQAYQRK